MQVAPIIAQELKVVKLENGSAQKSKVLRLLVHFNDHSLPKGDDDKSWDFVFAKTLPTIEYLYGGEVKVKLRILSPPSFDICSSKKRK